MTFLAALRHDRIEAPWFIEGPIDGDSFRLYVEILCPIPKFAENVFATCSCANFEITRGH